MRDVRSKEDDIIHDVQNGNIEAFDELVKLYSTKIFSLCYYFTCNIAEAEDLSQAVFIHALKGIGGFKFKSAFSTWLHQIAVNLWYDALRKNKKITYVSYDINTGKDEERTLKDEIIDSIVIPEIKMEKKELEEQIKKALNVITPDQRIAIVLKYIEGKSLEEISNICNCPIGTISARLTRGIKEIRKHLKPYINK
ncbi:MAG: sigma-70 family RNA polymerase sigma factor [Elusimicrobia bacterium]|nr:sigma-70 family RNA polymerase sigma factor [Candidatus Liberimonas magnetica]